MTRKVCVVVNSRANYGRIKSFLRAAQEHPDLELQLIVGASALLYRFGEVIKVMRADGFEPNSVVHSIVEGETPTTMAKSTGLAIVELATHFENLKPDVVLTVADRFETMATAIAASYMNIPLAHTQGGEVTGSIDESVRHAITKLAHIHFPATARAREFLIRMGEDPATVHLTGCPAIDLLTDIDLSMPPDLFERYLGVGAHLDPVKPYIVVLQHPVTTEYGQGFAQINQTLQAIAAIGRRGMQVAWLWPNVDAGSDDVAKGLRVFREKYQPDYIHFYRNFSPEDYARLINNAQCIVGNSSSGLREGAFLGVPCVNIGSRQSGRERAANVLDVPYAAEAIQAAIETQLAHGGYARSYLVGDGTAGRQIAEILAHTPLTIQKLINYVAEGSAP
ncbi:UDP-N-acetylglucosamine 2-epimerase [Lamprocystis purpurea]|uniref:UDP-N-acetylglucosamine 2-epimerase n=1 Tax=Lamprocystis purpurea TaxID=61598 RepID=UPI000362DEB2|nr:UDP-N-acetylglucosamine 2-epimerase [Lamprocystis purpurea]